jgi:hypothetical protein
MVDSISTKPDTTAAAFGVVVRDGDVAAIGKSYNILAALYLDVGHIMFMYLNPIPAGSFVYVRDSVECKTIENTTDYCVVETRNIAGVLTDASRLDVIVTSL